MTPSASVAQDSERRKRKRNLAFVLIALAAVHVALFARTAMQVVFMDGSWDVESLVVFGAILCWATVASMALARQAWLYANVAVRLDGRGGALVVERLLLRRLDVGSGALKSSPVRLVGDTESALVETGLLYRSATGSFVAISGFTQADGDAAAFLPIRT